MWNSRWQTGTSELQAPVLVSQNIVASPDIDAHGGHVATHLAPTAVQLSDPKRGASSFPHSAKTQHERKFKLLKKSSCAHVETHTRRRRRRRGCYRQPVAVEKI